MHSSLGYRKVNYASERYANFRPAWTSKFYDATLDYHRGGNDVLVDLGCGHAPVSLELSSQFTEVHACDPSQPMLKTAQSLCAGKSNISFHKALSGSLPFLKDKSVDLVVAAEAAHWFDYDQTWPELARVVKPGGTIAFWLYNENVFPKHPVATKIVDEHCFGGEGTMGPLFQQPGRQILKGLLKAVVPPEEDWADETRILYNPRHNGPGEKPAGERLIYQTVTLGAFEEYVRTISAYRGWIDKYPDRKPKADGGKGDIVDEMLEKMVEAEPEWKKIGNGWRDIEVEAEWGTVILLARRK